MRKLLKYFLLISLLNSFYKHSQAQTIIDEFKYALKSKVLSNVDSIVKQLIDTNRIPRYYVKHYIKRQIIDSFYEVTFNLVNYKTDEDYDVSIVCENNQLVYYKLDYDDSFIDHDSWIRLREIYNKKYNRVIYLNNLFLDDVIYGRACDVAGSLPVYRQKLDYLILNKNIRELDNWLSSPITELQVYAIDGFYQLYKSGYKLTPKEMELINLVKAKKGEIRICIGCDHTSFSISIITKEFDFQ